MLIRPSPYDLSNNPLSKYSHILRNGGRGFNTEMQGISHRPHRGPGLPGELGETPPALLSLADFSQMHAPPHTQGSLWTPGSPRRHLASPGREVPAPKGLGTGTREGPRETLTPHPLILSRPQT